jgi:hypothetical protein
MSAFEDYLQIGGPAPPEGGGDGCSTIIMLFIFFALLSNC